VTGWEIRQALRVILGHADTVIETGLAWLEPDELARLHRLSQPRAQTGGADAGLTETAPVRPGYLG
jgi:hypothetical protein